MWLMAGYCFTTIHWIQSYGKYYIVQYMIQPVEALLSALWILNLQGPSWQVVILQPVEALLSALWILNLQGPSWQVVIFRIHSTVSEIVQKNSIRKPRTRVLIII